MRQSRADSASWQHLYNSTRWRKLRLIHLGAAPLCRMCADEGRITAATVCDHIKPHKGDVALFYDPANLSSLCKHCHDRHKQSEERTGKAKPIIGLDGWPVERPRTDLSEAAHPSWLGPLAVHITIVCGPAASGKTTYVARHKGPRDIVLDLDAIAVARFGKPVAMLDIDQRLASLKERNQRLASLSAPEAVGQHDMAWLIVSEPTAAKRRWWHDRLKPASIIVIETPLDECIARYKSDTAQRRPADTPNIIARWWRDYTRRDGETIITPSNAPNA